MSRQSQWQSPATWWPVVPQDSPLSTGSGCVSHPSRRWHVTPKRAEKSDDNVLEALEARHVVAALEPLPAPCRRRRAAAGADVAGGGRREEEGDEEDGPRH